MNESTSPNRAERHKMSIKSNIIKELYEAEKNYLMMKREYAKIHPYGVDMCGEFISSKSASDAYHMGQAMARAEALKQLVVTHPLVTDAAMLEIFDREDRAETEAEINKAYDDFKALILKLRQ